jgi:tRNA(fMet)-specific endonuclease VapC
MTYLYLLDTNIVSDLVKHPSGKIAQRITEVGEGASQLGAEYKCL